MTDTVRPSRGDVPVRRGRLRGWVAPAPVRWRTVLTLAVLLAYADGFWLTSVQGAVGAIERAQSPSTLWLLSSTVMVPLYVLAVLVALGVARRRVGGLSTGRQVVLGGLLVVLAVTLLATGEALVSAALDYRLQAQLVAVSHALHSHGSSLADQLELTRRTDVAGARYAVLADLVTNVVLVGWLLALQGGRLVSPLRHRWRHQVTHE